MGTCRDGNKAFTGSVFGALRSSPISPKRHSLGIGGRDVSVTLLPSIILGVALPAQKVDENLCMTETEHPPRYAAHSSTVPMLDRLPSFFLNHIELWLSGAGLLVIFGVSLIVGPSGLAFWRLIALIAVGVGVLHGFIFWAVRRRQRQVRRQSIHEIQQMLSDVLKNKLAVINMYLPEEENQELVEQELDGIRTSIEDIAAEIENISEESIEGWKAHYSEAVERTTNL